MEDHDQKPEYRTLAYLPELSAACLRVMVLDDEKSGIDKLEPWVRFRIEDAARTLDDCARRMAALERYVELVIGAEKEAFAELCEATSGDGE